LPEKLPLRKINEQQIARRRRVKDSRTTDRDAPDPITTSRYPHANAGESGENQNRGTCMSPAQCSVSENDDTAKFARRDFVVIFENS